MHAAQRVHSFTRFLTKRPRPSSSLVAFSAFFWFHLRSPKRHTVRAAPSQPARHAALPFRSMATADVVTAPWKLFAPEPRHASLPFLLNFFFSLELIVLNFSLLLQLQSRPKHLSVSGSLSSQNRLCSWGAACTLGSSFTSTPEFPSGSLRCRIPPLPASHDFLFLGFLAARWSPPPRSFLRKGRGCRF